jgi:nucleoid-associated protein YgaU
MSILDFAKDIGSNLFNTDSAAADNINEMLSIKLTPIKNLTVDYDNGTVTLCGECMNQQHREQAILLAGNVKGVDKVVSDELTYPRPVADETTADEPTADEPTADKPLEEKIEFYEIKSGDTLSGIAKEFYGDFSMYTKIFEANREVIGDPDKIYPGQKIRIPLA